MGCFPQTSETLEATIIVIDLYKMIKEHQFSRQEVLLG